MNATIKKLQLIRATANIDVDFNTSQLKQANQLLFSAFSDSSFLLLSSNAMNKKLATQKAKNKFSSKAQ